MSKDEQAVLVKMETDLIDDKSGAYKKELVQKLMDQKAAIKAKLNKGLPPEEFAPLEAFTNALDAAVKIVETYWAKKH